MGVLNIKIMQCLTVDDVTLSRAEMFFDRDAHHAISAKSFNRILRIDA